jgi:hypothetical protein
MHQDMQAQLGQVSICILARRNGSDLGQGLFDHAEFEITLGSKERPFTHFS